MKARKVLTVLLTVALMLSLLTACGGASSSSYKGDAMEMMAAEAPAAAMDSVSEEMGYTAANSLTTESAAGASAIPENRKWIITVDMSAETEDLDALLKALDEHISTLNGYVEGQNIHNGSSYSQRRYRSANLTVRIPAENVDAFTQEVSGISNVVSSNKNLEDITLNYVSTESRMKALQTEEARLLELMEQAETMSDLLEIEARLTDVRYELESVTSRLRTYDNQVNYATIYLYIDEVQEYTPAVERTVWQRITEDFSSNLKSLGEDIVDFLVWLIVTSPYLVIWAVMIAAVILLAKRLKKGGLLKRAKKAPTAKAEPGKEEKKE